ncbi:integrase arm-type DNA-binding domain-containing protein [Roseomonas sp. NAR14]|uniref:Integrase arm-type DNA-binding domain-containing protein n=1 Tax=Roseomonas acroporae TaxID=2937791 RepID=A0A9X2C061_9PROT|nr:site-specific integrase [Roseomonas acroporae]MCK8787815.1 integrase arm-type DNA-binding domain-containing protein [Roseomonas acroporae]
MARKVTPLTVMEVRAKKPGRYGDGGGLYLLVRSEEGRFWVFRYVLGGRMREMGLGRAAGKGMVSLAEARTKAKALMQQVRAGIDPLQQRAAEAEAAVTAAMAEEAVAARRQTFRSVAELYISAHEKSWRNAKHAAQWHSSLATHAYPVLGDMPVEDIDTGHVMQVLEPIWHRTTETASRVRGRIEAILSYAATHQWRGGDNPARWRGHLANLLPPPGRVKPVEHLSALPWREMAAFMADLRAREGVAALALEFAILTAARSGEVRGMVWGEVNTERALWVVPPGRMKAGKEHRVPLSASALKVLMKMQPLRDRQRGDLVFPSPIRLGAKLSDQTLTALLMRMERSGLTVHGFRSSFRDWAAEATSYSNDLAEMALAHRTGSKVEAAYRRGDMLEKRARLMADWAAWCDRQP